MGMRLGDLFRNLSELSEKKFGCGLGPRLGQVDVLLSVDETLRIESEVAGV